MGDTQGVNGVLARPDDVTAGVEQLHVQHLAQVCWTPGVRSRHVCLEPQRLVLEIPHVVEVQIDLLLRHHLAEVHRLLDIRQDA